MTGTAIKKIRTDIGVSPFAFAALLGVHVSTIYRWEGLRTSIAVDPMQAALLERLSKHLVDTRSGKKLERLIVNGLVAGGPLKALRDVLVEIV